jgi:hypothetical protein
VLDSVDGLADELLIVVPPTVPAPTGLVASYAGRLVEAADAYPDSLSAAARRESQGTWLLTLGAGEMLAPGSAEALPTWLQTVDAITTGAMIPCQDWPRTGIAPVRRVEQRLWRQAPGSHPPAVPSLVPGVAIWQPARETPDTATSPVPAMPAPPPETLLPAVLRLMQGDLAGARSDLLSWRRLAPVQDPDRETCDEWLITTALALGDWPLALSLADTVLSSGCQRPVLAIQAATVLQAVGDARGAAYACHLAGAARQDWRHGPADIDWQPELILASLMLGADGPTTAAAWLSQRHSPGPLPVMQSLLGMLTGQVADLPDAGILELATELANGGWLTDADMSRVSIGSVNPSPCTGGG